MSWKVNATVMRALIMSIALSSSVVLAIFTGQSMLDMAFYIVILATVVFEFIKDGEKKEEKDFFICINCGDKIPIDDKIIKDNNFSLLCESCGYYNLFVRHLSDEECVVEEDYTFEKSNGEK